MQAARELFAEALGYDEGGVFNEVEEDERHAARRVRQEGLLLPVPRATHRVHVQLLEDHAFETVKIGVVLVVLVVRVSLVDVGL